MDPLQPRLDIGSGLFNIFVSDVDDGVECTFNQVAEDGKLEGAADTPEGHAATQKDFSRLEK